MADSDDPGNGDGVRGGLLPLLVALALVTVCAVAGAAGLAWIESGKKTDEKTAAAGCTPEQKEQAELDDKISTVIDLPSIVTNLAGEDAPWLRMDASVVVPLATAKKQELAGELSQDFLSYVRSLSASDLAGGTNLYLLKRDLKEIARTRTSDASLDVLIRTLVVE